MEKHASFLVTQSCCCCFFCSVVLSAAASFLSNRLLFYTQHCVINAYLRKIKLDKPKRYTHIMYNKRYGWKINWQHTRTHTEYVNDIVYFNDNKNTIYCSQPAIKSIQMIHSVKFVLFEFSKASTTQTNWQWNKEVKYIFTSK